MTSFQTPNGQHQILDSSDEDDCKSLDDQSNDVVITPYKPLQIKYDSLVQELNSKNKLYDKLLEDHKQLQTEYDILEDHFEKLESDLMEETELNNTLQNDYEMEISNMEILLTNTKQMNNELTIQCSEWRNHYNKLKEQHNTMEIEYTNLVNKYNKLQYKGSNYLTWNSSQIFEWIINIKQHFSDKYSDILNKNIFQEGIDGKCLQFINKNDLHRLGITGFKDKNDIYMSIQNLIEQTKRLRYYEYEYKQKQKYKQIKRWNMDDILKWIIDMNIPNKWYYNIINIIEINNITMEDIITLKSNGDVSESFGIHNDIKLCNRILDEIKKLQLKWERNNNIEWERKEDIGIVIDRTFKINLFSQGKLVILNEKVNKNVTIKQIKKMYKRQTGIMVKTKDIYLYSQLKRLPSNKTLKEVNITNDKHLITVKFGIDGARIKR